MAGYRTSQDLCILYTFFGYTSIVFVKSNYFFVSCLIKNIKPPKKINMSVTLKIGAFFFLTKIKSVTQPLINLSKKLPNAPPSKKAAESLSKPDFENVKRVLSQKAIPPIIKAVKTVITFVCFSKKFQAVPYFLTCQIYNLSYTSSVFR